MGRQRQPGLGPQPYGKCMINVIPQSRASQGLCKLPVLDDRSRGTGEAWQGLLDQRQCQRHLADGNWLEGFPGGRDTPPAWAPYHLHALAAPKLAGPTGPGPDTRR